MFITTKLDLLLQLKKGWAHADNLALKLCSVKKISDLKKYQMDILINELRAQVEEAGGVL